MAHNVDDFGQHNSGGGMGLFEKILIILGVIAGIIAVGLLVVCGIYLYCQCRSKKRQETVHFTPRYTPVVLPSHQQESAL